jgi:hypothetical protein
MNATRTHDFRRRLRRHLGCTVVLTPLCSKYSALFKRSMEARKEEGKGKHRRKDSDAELYTHSKLEVRGSKGHMGSNEGGDVGGPTGL